VSKLAEWRIPASKFLAHLPLFDPEQGTTVREPLGTGLGWWAGAPAALYDAASGYFYLYYRYRKPRELGRGVECRIARSTDGFHFQDIWRMGKEQFQTQSVEKACLIKADDQLWRLYISFVDTDGRWRIDMLEAPAPEAFDPASRTKILTADDCGAEGVKDPVVLNLGGWWHMLVSYAPTPVGLSDQQRASLHATGDVYNVGLTKSHTGLATSTDGVHWRWEGDVLSPPDEGWDAYCTRIGAVLYRPPVFIGFYDGSRSVAENYEEKAGLAVSFDLRAWQRLTLTGPYVLSPHASRSVRYVEVIEAQGCLWYYYEYTRATGCHELRANRVPLPT
jgi:hypothetical protein